MRDKGLLLKHFCLLLLIDVHLHILHRHKESNRCTYTFRSYPTHLQNKVGFFLPQPLFTYENIFALMGNAITKRSFMCLGQCLHFRKKYVYMYVHYI